MKKIGSLAVPAGEYTNAEGEEKTRWLRIGVLFQKDKRYVIKLDSIPIGLSEWEGWVQVFAEREDEGGGGRKAPPKKTHDFDDDEIPF